MYDLIPLILDTEKAKIRSEIKDKHVSVIYDGTTRLSEVLAVVLCYLDGWEIKQRLVRLEMLTKSMSGEKVARELINNLSMTYSIKSDLVVAAMRDGASVNEAAMRVVKIVYPNTLDVRCFSHTLDLVGNKFQTSVLSEFSTAWISLFSHSAKTKALWKEQTGKAMAYLSKTRWWSRWEIYNQLLVQLADIKPFLESNAEVGPSIRPKLLGMISDNQTLARLKMELTTIVDVGEKFVKSTYNLEGDGPLVLKCFEEIETLQISLQTGHNPNMQAIARTLGPGNPSIQQQWIQYGMNCVNGGIKYFQDKFSNDSRPPLNAFKAARLFSPSKVNDMQPLAADVDLLKCITVLNKDLTIAALEEELQAYVARTIDVSALINELEWFKKYERDIPSWASAFKQVVLIQPSSAAAERVFSLLNASFSTKQTCSLEDYVECSIMLQYNNR